MDDKDNLEEKFEKEVENYETKKIENNSDSLQDYEIEIPEKKSFWAKLIDKFKINKNQKLLESGESEKIKKTGKSIAFLWGYGTLRKEFLEKVDEAYKKLVNKKDEESKNDMITEIIGKESNLVEDLKTANKKVAKIIIPKNVEKRHEE